jgi:hypothetical protein
MPPRQRLEFIVKELLPSAVVTMVAFKYLKIPPDPCWAFLSMFNKLSLMSSKAIMNKMEMLMRKLAFS